ncbi:MAG: CoB--CoM heterodisulfide reductase iron-sulfur subunit B family protein [Candidatus Bathyarchaeia archaeon]
MKYAYFPGCSVISTAREYGESCKAVSRVLGIELMEIPDWNCCGAMDAIYAYNPSLSIALAARNLSLVESMKMDMLTLCSACFFTLRRANKLLREDSAIKNKIDKMLSGTGLNYNGEVGVRHYLSVLADDIGFEKVSESVKIPLDGLKVAPYYGCMLIRPPDIVDFDDPEHPRSMDKLVEALGAESVDYVGRIRCCGASLGMTEEDVMMRMTKELLLNAKDADADCMIVACPMCHFNLDVKQRDIESTFDVKIDLPILYFTQLVGVAFGLNPKELALNKNFASPTKLLQRLGIR